MTSNIEEGSDRGALDGFAIDLDASREGIISMQGSDRVMCHRNDQVFAL